MAISYYFDAPVHRAIKIGLQHDKLKVQLHTEMVSGFIIILTLPLEITKKKG